MIPDLKLCKSLQEENIRVENITEVELDYTKYIFEMNTLCIFDFLGQSAEFSYKRSSTWTPEIDGNIINVMFIMFRKIRKGGLSVL